VFGVRPWEWDRMTAAEVFNLIAYIDQQNKQSQGVDGGDL
jgi:hypothetical protein